MSTAITISKRLDEVEEVEQKWKEWDGQMRGEVDLTGRALVDICCTRRVGNGQDVSVVDELGLGVLGFQLGKFICRCSSSVEKRAELLLDAGRETRVGKCLKFIKV